MRKSTVRTLLDQPYQGGERAMRKVKQQPTADRMVGSFRHGKNSPHVGSLLLGLYHEAGLLNHAGFTSALDGQDKVARTDRLEALAGTGFTGKAPGGPSRWSNGRVSEWYPLEPELIVESNL